MSPEVLPAYLWSRVNMAMEILGAYSLTDGSGARNSVQIHLKDKATN